MNEGYLARLKLVEQQIQVMRNDMNKALNEVMDVVTKMMTAHRMFTIYVDENLRELREKVGLGGALLTDSLEKAPPEPVSEKKDGGVEL